MSLRSMEGSQVPPPVRDVSDKLCPLAGLPGAEVKPALPNIVVFLVDDMGVMDTSVPFLTDGAGRPRRYPLNDHYHLGL